MDGATFISKVIQFYAGLLCFCFVLSIQFQQLPSQINQRMDDVGMLKRKRARTQRSSSDNAVYLPDVVLFKILSNFPAKTLCKLKCVSKNWKKWISSDPFFRKLQCRESLKAPRLISIYHLKDSEQQQCTVRLVTTDIACGQILDEFQVRIASSNERPFYQVTSCRGLICLFSDSEIVVCNPSNHELLRIRDNEQNPLNCVGTGYVASSNTYKVVRLHCIFVDGFSRLGCKIFRLKEFSEEPSTVLRVLKTMSFEPFDVSAIDERLPICVNGVMFWMMKYSDDNTNLAYYLDLENDEFGAVPCPRLKIEDKILLSVEELKLVELHGFLCLECYRPLTSSLSFYALKDVKFGKWEWLYSISLLPAVPRHGSPRVLGSVPSYHQQDEIIIVHYDPDDGRETVYRCMYGNKSRSVQKVEIPNKPKGRYKFLHFDGLFSFKPNALL